MYRRLWLGLVFFTALTTVNAGEWSVNNVATIELRLFTEAQYDNQHGHDLSGAIELENIWVEADHRFTVKPFIRYDKNDNERSHVDLREFYWQYFLDDVEFAIGVHEVFWGVAESSHLVNIINQSDNLEGLDNEDKLGQPMINITWDSSMGVVSLFSLPYFRTRDFADEEGRFRLPYLVNESLTEYESGAKEHHMDWAVRYQTFVSDWDLGLSYFSGTDRRPILLPAPQPNELIPYYQQIDQMGLDLQYTGDALLLKLEAINRETQAKTINAAVAGIEYTLYGVFESGLNLGLLLEYSKHNDETELLQDDIFLGARIAYNDIQNSQLLAGYYYDRGYSTSLLSVEYSRRVRDSWLVSVELIGFFNVDKNDVLAAIAEDNMLRVELSHYF